MTTHLFLFTLGPVQSFIAQARKTQDLYAGSEILIKLVCAGILAYKDAFAAQAPNLIFPADGTDGSAKSLPNRFIGKLTGHNLTDEELKEKAEEIKAAVKTKFSTIATEALKNARASEPTGFEQQLQAHLEIFWAFQEVEREGGYALAFKSLEGLGRAIKNVRPFEQFAYQNQTGETGRKCGMDGINNVRFYRLTDTGDGRNVEPSHLAEGANRIRGFSLNSGEGLSAVSLVKRFCKDPAVTDKNAFPSTAEVALMYDEQQLPEEAKKMLKCYKKLFDKKTIAEACIEIFKEKWIKKIDIKNLDKNENWNDQFDYQMLYEENLTSKNIPDPVQLDLLWQLHGQLKKCFKTKYYAVLRFDGDKMGKWLAGENNKSIQDLELFHDKLSGLLSRFSQEAYKYLKDSKHGHAVYAGGDDFLGFVNVHHLFEVMARLRKEFHRTVNLGLEDFKKTDEHLTFSAGIVIAHYKTPFSEVLKKAREVEQKAKNEGGRNAFAITTLKHSGEVQEAVFKWNEKESADGLSNWEALESITKALDKELGCFSNTFIQNLTNEFHQLTGVDLHEIDAKNRSAPSLEKALLCEIKRLVHRSLDKSKDATKAAEQEIQLTDAVQALWEQAQYPKARNFIHALHVADFITRKTDQ